MDKDKDWLDDYYKLSDPLGLDDWDRDGHYDAEERMWIEMEERQLIDKINQSHDLGSIEDDYDDEDDLDFDEDEDSECDDDEDYEVDFEDEDEDDYEVEHDEVDDDEEVSCERGLGLRLTFSLGSSDDDSDEIEENNEAPYERTNRIPTDFIKRDLELEKKLGIDDIRFYCYWDHFFSDTLRIQGEIVAEHLKKEFSLRGEIYDDEGDLINLKQNSTYTGGSGWSVFNIKTEVFFNRYPFEIVFSWNKNSKLPNLSIVPDIDEDDKEELDRSKFTKSYSTLDIEKELSAPAPEVPKMISQLNKGEKFPKSLVQYVIEDYIGITEIKSVFFKENENNGDDWANQLAFTTILSGKVKIDSLIYYMFYNEQNELVRWFARRLDQNNYKNYPMKEFENLPLNVKIGRIIVYVGIHPFGCTDKPKIKKIMG